MTADDLSRGCSVVRVGCPLGAIFTDSLGLPGATPRRRPRQRGRWRQEGLEEMGMRLKMVRLDRVRVGVAVGRGRPFLFVSFLE